MTPSGGGFAENVGPDFGREFFERAVSSVRIGTIDAVQRAAVGEFGDKGERWRNAHPTRLTAPDF